MPELQAPLLSPPILHARAAGHPAVIAYTTCQSSRPRCCHRIHYMPEMQATLLSPHTLHARAADHADVTAYTTCQSSRPRRCHRIHYMPDKQATQGHRIHYMPEQQATLLSPHTLHGRDAGHAAVTAYTTWKSSRPRCCHRIHYMTEQQATLLNTQGKHWFRCLH